MNLSSAYQEYSTFIELFIVQCRQMMQKWFARLQFISQKLPENKRRSISTM